jgi:diguanylate cyclase
MAGSSCWTELRQDLCRFFSAQPFPASADYSSVEAMSNRIVELGLHEVRRASHTANMATFRALLCELLDFFDEVLTSTDEGLDGENLCDKVAHYRGQLAAAVDQAQLAAIASPLLAVCQETFERLKHQREGVRNELAGLIVTVRDAIGGIIGESAAFSSDLNDSAERLDALRRIPNIQELKAGLAREVRALKHVARHREERWQETVAIFEERVARLENELRTSQREASIDPLTQVANRRAFDRVLRTSMETPGRRFTLAIFDIDDFKRINDNGGHSKGDEVLRNVADTLKSAVRGDDVVARIGGDEFALIASGLTLHQADRRMRSMMAMLAEGSMGIVGSMVTVSCGIAEFSAGDTPQSLITRADEAVYEAKRQGKNHIITRTTPYIRDLKAS